MKTTIQSLTIVLFTFFLFACNNDDIDTDKPEIDLSIAEAFPTNCDTIYFGEPFKLKVRFSDNVELSSFSLDIHNNFNHHSHSTEIIECDLNAKKDPVNPYVYIDSFSIPENENDYSTDILISIPAENENGTLDEGDYHFYIKLTDKEGWSTQKGLSIKMYYK